jgi:hypothetical protein
LHWLFLIWGIMNERRHRIDKTEIHVVIAAVADYLRKKCAAKDDLDSATLAFMVWWRLVRDRVGNPGYPELLDWQTIREHLAVGSIAPPVEDLEEIQTPRQGEQG